ncbi:hypothetical protein B0J13DRAFT_606988 [Dactylonectria estremocensis]|uniref:Uncharacterized protein n=1 Tax=Dactylonectria estremocensis TaxID=1079267 RepID=A0A9P9EX25_9HYPO|nr:hypothetical protein B0J13DRAFT_606988 [Dactylonectria estremocensis]
MTQKLHWARSSQAEVKPTLRSSATPTPWSVSRLCPLINQGRAPQVTPRRGTPASVGHAYQPGCSPGIPKPRPDQTKERSRVHYTSGATSWEVAPDCTEARGFGGWLALFFGNPTVTGLLSLRHDFLGRRTARQQREAWGTACVGPFSHLCLQMQAMMPQPEGWRDEGLKHKDHALPPSWRDLLQIWLADDDVAVSSYAGRLVRSDALSPRSLPSASRKTRKRTAASKAPSSSSARRPTKRRGGYSSLRGSVSNRQPELVHFLEDYSPDPLYSLHVGSSQALWVRESESDSWSRLRVSERDGATPEHPSVELLTPEGSDDGCLPQNADDPGWSESPMVSLRNHLRLPLILDSMLRITDEGEQLSEGSRSALRLRCTQEQHRIRSFARSLCRNCDDLYEAAPNPVHQEFDVGCRQSQQELEDGDVGVQGDVGPGSTVEPEPVVKSGYIVEDESGGIALEACGESTFQRTGGRDPRPIHVEDVDKRSGTTSHAFCTATFRPKTGDGEDVGTGVVVSGASDFVKGSHEHIRQFSSPRNSRETYKALFDSLGNETNEAGENRTRRSDGEEWISLLEAGHGERHIRVIRMEKMAVGLPAAMATTITSRRVEA